MKLRYILTAAISGILISTALSAPVSAQVIGSGVGVVSPMYEIAKNPIVSLDVLEHEAICSSSITGINVVKIEAVQTLEKRDGSDWNPAEDASWTSTVKTNTIVMYNTKSDLESGKYRLKTVFTLTDKYGKTETVTVYSDTKTVA